MSQPEKPTEESSDATTDADAPAHAAEAGAPPRAARSAARSSSRRASSRSELGSGSEAARDRPLAAYELLARSARLSDLASLTTRIVTDAARTRAAGWAFASKSAAAAEEIGLAREDADTRFGNALDVLATGGETESQRALAAALWAHAIAAERPADDDRLAGDLLWLATHTAFDATPLLDRALGDDADRVWTAVAGRIRRTARGKGGALGRGEALVGCAALAASGSERAKALSAELARELEDPVLVRMLETSERAAPLRLEGELVRSPRGPVATALLAVTGLLFAAHAARLLARSALAYRRPAEATLSEIGVRVTTRTQLLGRTLREQEHVIPRAGLARVVREVRFPRAAFYAGLLALVVGSFVGVRMFVDGVRAASPSLLLVGFAFIALGIALDFVLGTLVPGARSRCRVAFVPHKGRAIYVGDVDAARADDALERSLSRG